MGVAVDDLLPLGAGYSTPEVAHHDQWNWTTPYARYRAGWGPPFSPLDGVRLAFDAARWALVEFHRYGP